MVLCCNCKVLGTGTWEIAKTLSFLMISKHHHLSQTDFSKILKCVVCNWIFKLKHFNTSFPQVLHEPFRYGLWWLFFLSFDSWQIPTICPNSCISYCYFLILGQTSVAHSIYAIHVLVSVDTKCLLKYGNMWTALGCLGCLRSLEMLDFNVKYFGII